MHTCYRTAKGSEIHVYCRVCPSPHFLLITRRECSLICKGPLNSRLCPDSLAEHSFARTFSPSRETHLQAHLCYPINPSCSRENIFFYKRDCFHLPNFSFWVAYSFQNSKDILLNIFSGTYVEHFRISFKLEYLPGLCHGVAKSWTWLSNYHFDFSLFLYHEKQATETSFYSLI